MKKYQYKLDNRELNYIIGNGFIRIDESFNDDIFRSYFLICADNYGFSGFSDEIEEDELNFYFDVNHPLYLPFLNFLNNKNEIIINSDYSKEKFDNLKYIKISREKDTICLSFVNRILSEHYSMEKFDFEIINIMYDIRSKLDHKDEKMKQSIANLFEDINSILVDDDNKILDDDVYVKRML